MTCAHLGTLLSSNMAGWKIPELHVGFNRKVTDRLSDRLIDGSFSIAMFDYRRVVSIWFDVDEAPSDQSS